jgi:hypothetical protein
VERYQRQYLVFWRMLNGPVFVSSFRVADVANEIYVCLLGTQDFHVHKNFDVVYFYFVFTKLYVLCRWLKALACYLILSGRSFGAEHETKTIFKTRPCFSVTLYLRWCRDALLWSFEGDSALTKIFRWSRPSGSWSRVNTLGQWLVAITSVTGLQHTIRNVLKKECTEVTI